MKKIFDFLKAHRFIRAFVVLSLIFMILLVGNIVYEYIDDKFFDYHKEFYCENGYELKNEMCYKLYTSEPTSYECEDSENYELLTNSWCVLKRDLLVEPEIKKGKQCKSVDHEYTDKYGQLRCKEKLNYDYYPSYITGEYTPIDYTEVICPDGYSKKNVYYNSHNSTKEMCVLDKYAPRDYKAGVSSKVICPSGYTYQVVDKERKKLLEDYCYGSECYRDKNPYVSSYKDVDVMGCGKTVTVEAKYRKVHN